MKLEKRLLICSFWIITTSVAAQEIITETSAVGSYVSFTYDNDFFNASDRYYTQGIRLEFSFPFLQKSPVSKLLIPFQQQAFQQYGIALQQDCFTPPSIRRDTIQTGERPFSGVVFLSHFLTSTQPQQRRKLITQLDIGIIGPCAKCKEEQEGIHDWLDNIEPLGWEFQLANDLVLNYSLQLEKGLWSKKHLELVGYGRFRAGTLYDDATVGTFLRAGWMKPYFENAKQVNRNFQFYTTLNANVRAVGYNATLQGGLFNPNDIYTLKAKDVNRAVVTTSVGLVMAYKKVALEFERVFVTPESKGRGLHHGWGHINIKVGM